VTSLRRLFWTFAPGVPGAGLFIMRAVAATALTAEAFGGRSAPIAAGSATIMVFQAAAGLLLLVGLWTPVAGLVVVVLEAWPLFSRPGDPWTHVLLATVGGALALLGPGAWSADAWLFGWKRIDIRDRRSRADTSAAPKPYQKKQASDPY
jgi:putative oxidoreductase